MTVPGFQLEDDHQLGVPSLRLDFLSGDHPGSFDWNLPVEVPASSVDWKVTAAVRTAFLGAGKLQGFWETREFKASTVVKPEPSSSAPDAGSRTMPRNGTAGAARSDQVQQVPPMMPGAPAMGF